MPKSLLLSLNVAGHLAYMVLVPLFIFGGAGLLLDRSVGTLPLYTLIGIGIAFVSTMLWMTTRLKEIIKQMAGR